MALTNCPECQLQVSTKAYACPHCGYPLKEDDSSNKSRKAVKRRMRLPNGFGQISLIKNRNLRNPYRAMVTVGTNEFTGRSIVKPLKPVAYFKTYNEAYNALVEYNKDPYTFGSDMTMKELYEAWSNVHFEKISEGFIKVIRGAWKYAKPIENMKVSEVRSRHLKTTINNVPYESTKTKLKIVFNQMYKYAIEYEIVDKNYASMFSIDKSVTNKSKKAHNSFNKEELDLLWAHTDISWCKIILIECYMGWRPGELCVLKLKDVDLENWTIIGGLKTEAGMNRIVPIHNKIKDFVKEEYYKSKKLESDYFISCTDGIDKNDLKLTYEKYRHRFYKVMKESGIIRNHKPHDTRKTFVTMLKLGKADEYAIKLMAGHEIKDITESVYTDRGLDFLREELNKLDENIK